MVKSSKNQGARRLDGLIVLGEPASRAASSQFNVKGRDVVAIQAKARTLEMSIMGQCLFSRDLLLALGVRSVRSVALCVEDDVVLRPLLERYQGCEVVVAKVQGPRS